MSRVGKAPVPLLQGATVAIENGVISINGPLGALSFILPNQVNVTVSEEKNLLVSPIDSSPEARALYGTVRAIVANMVKGVVSGFEKKLLLVGVGYRAQVKDKLLKLQLGFSHDVEYCLPDGITAEMANQTEIVIKGTDKQKVGQVAAEIRAYRPPEPYKGKGVRYSDETVLLKETKKK